jgi:DNA-binding transcriptional LysR family regulator
VKANEFSELNAFIAVAEERNFRRAAARLNVIPSTLSHAIRSLEESLGVRLLNRTTRTVVPTEAGAALLAEISPAFDIVKDAVERVKEHRASPKGTVRINASQLAANLVLVPILKTFTARYPDVSLEIDINETVPDIVRAGFDAGIRTGEFIDQDMVAVRVSEDFRMAIVGSPDYFRDHPIPESPHDLTGHRCINYRFPDGNVYRWEFEKDGRPITVRLDGPLTVNSADLVLSSTLDGIGLAYATEGMVQPHIKTGRLVRVLEDWSPTFPGYYLFYPTRRQLSAAMVALVDSLRTGA